jgi:hypothetical protein
MDAMIGLTIIGALSISAISVCRGLAYIGSPQDIYFTTLNKITNCREAYWAKYPEKATGETLDQICGKIPNISQETK